MQTSALLEEKATVQTIAGAALDEPFSIAQGVGAAL